jgi:hypothetical protein
MDVSEEAAGASNEEESLKGAEEMKRISAFIAVLAASVAAASPAIADDHARDAHARATDRIDRYGYFVPETTWGTPAPKIQPGQPTWPVNPTPLPKPASGVPAADDGGGGSVWLLLGAGFVTAGIVGGSAAGIARRNRLRARHAAV